MNSIVVRFTVTELENLIKFAKKFEGTQKVFTEFEGKGVPECIHVVVTDDNVKRPS